MTTPIPPRRRRWLSWRNIALGCAGAVGGTIGLCALLFVLVPSSSSNSTSATASPSVSAQAVAVASVSASPSVSAAPTATQRPTNTAEPTQAPSPTNTTEPTGTPQPTATTRPTNTPAPPTNTPAPPTATPEPTPTIGVGSDVRIQQARFKIIEVANVGNTFINVQSSERETVTTDKTFVRIRYEAENTGTETASLRDVQLVDQEGNEIQPEKVTGSEEYSDTCYAPNERVEPGQVYRCERIYTVDPTAQVQLQVQAYSGIFSTEEARVNVGPIPETITAQEVPPEEPAAVDSPPPAAVEPPPSEPAVVVPPPVAPPPAAGGECDPHYPTVCIQPFILGDVNCPQVPYSSFTVLPPDPHDLDGNNNNGIGCENN